MIAIIPIDHGKSVLPENSIFQNGAEDKKHPILLGVYLLKFENRPLWLTSAV